MIDHLKKLWAIDKTTIIGGGAIMLAAMLWSLDGVFIRPKFYELPAGLVVFLEHALGFIVLSPFIFLGWSKIRLLKAKEWLAISWVCFFGGALGTIMITKAFFAAVGGDITFATIVLLQKLQPIFALLLARLILGEKLKRSFYLWATVAVTAAYFLAFGKTGLPLGQINLWHHAAGYAVLAAFAFGSSTVFGKRIVNHLDFKSTAALRFAFTSLIMLAYIIITGEVFRITSIGVIYWRYLAIIVFTSGAVAMFIYYFGLKRVTASASTILELFWPLSAVVLDYLLNKNVLSSLQIFSSLIMLFAIIKILSRDRKENYQFSADIVSGSGRGSRLGFPTINLDKVDLDLDYGVYLVEAEIDNKIYRGLLHFGLKETFSEAVSVELFIKETISIIYQKRVKIKIINKIREVKKFKDVNELTIQIEEDLKVLNN